MQLFLDNLHIGVAIDHDGGLTENSLLDGIVGEHPSSQTRGITINCIIELN